MKLSIIIINYKSKHLIEKCLQSISFSGSFEIILIDNDGSIENFSHKGVKLIPYTRNLGFGGGNNTALEQAKGEYILALNADVLLTPTYITKCIAFLEKNGGYSSVQGKLLLPSNSNIDSAGNYLTTWGFGYSEHRLEENRKLISKEIFGVCAAAAIYRKKALEDAMVLGEYFDPDFFAYLEDVDLDWRFQLLGYKAYFIDDAVAYHIRGASTNYSYSVRQALRNRLFMMLKNASLLRMFSNLIFYSPILLFLPQRMENISLIFKMFKKRRVIQRKKKASHSVVKKFAKPGPPHHWREIPKLLGHFFIR